MSTDPDAVLAIYLRAIEKAEGIEVKGAANKYTSLNGHMFSFLTKESAIAVRFDEETRAAKAKKFGTEPVVQHGATMKGYVEVPLATARRTASLVKLLEESAAYIATLPPKATKRKKAGSKKARRRP